MLSHKRKKRNIIIVNVYVKFEERSVTIPKLWKVSSNLKRRSRDYVHYEGFIVGLLIMITLSLNLKCLASSPVPKLKTVCQNFRSYIPS